MRCHWFWVFENGWSFDWAINGRGFIFLHLKSEKSTVFEHKRGVLGKGKMENFGCFMVFSRSLNFPNGEFKTKKPVGLTGVDTKNQFYIIQAAQDACASYLRTANVS